MNTIKEILKGILILIAGIFTISTFNTVGRGVLNAIFGSEMNGEGIPTTDGSTVAFLIMIFLAGMTASMIISFLSSSNPWILIGIFTLIAFVADFVALKGPLEILPGWAQIVVIVTIPPQMWLGAKIGINLREKWWPE